jgi:hypothetical protein
MAEKMIKEPAHVPLSVSVGHAKISLTGDLNDSADTRERLESALRRVRGGEWTVDAGRATVIPEGVEAWVSVVRRHLRDCSLIYVPSQLGFILQHDETYDHPNSHYADDE